MKTGGHHALGVGVGHGNVLAEQVDGLAAILAGERRNRQSSLIASSASKAAI